MKLYELLSNLDSKVPIKVVELSPPECPEETQHTQVIYDSENTYLFSQLRSIFDHMFTEDYIVNRISLCDNDYLFRLYITVVRA